MTIVRKATGRVIDRGISKDTLEFALSTLPLGVYDIEDSDGTTIGMAVVNRNLLKINLTNAKYVVKLRHSFNREVIE